MRQPRFYCEQINSLSVLDEEQSHHLSRVLRLEAGAIIELFDGCGTLARGTVERIERRKVVIRAFDIQQHSKPQSGRLILAVSYAKGQRFDWMVEKCTELGVDHVVAVQFERTVKLGSENAVARLQKLSISASKQSGRLFLPDISGPLQVRDTLRLLKEQYPDALRCCGDVQGRPLKPEDTAGRDLVVLIGPEGGPTADELEWIRSENIERVTINENILRVETAAVAFCALAKAKRS